MKFLDLTFWEVATLIGCALWIYYMVRQIRKRDGKTRDGRNEY